MLIQIMRMSFSLFLITTDIAYVWWETKRFYVSTNAHKSTLRKKTESSVHLDDYVYRDLCLNLIKPFQMKKKTENLANLVSNLALSHDLDGNKESAFSN